MVWGNIWVILLKTAWESAHMGITHGLKAGESSIGHGGLHGLHLLEFSLQESQEEEQSENLLWVL